MYLNACLYSEEWGSNILVSTQHIIWPRLQLALSGISCHMLNIELFECDEIIDKQNYSAV